MTVMPPSMTAAERYLELLKQGDTHGAGVYLDRISEDDDVDPWTVIEALGHKLADLTNRPAEQRTTPDVQLAPEGLAGPANTGDHNTWNEALGAAGFSRYQ